MNLKEVLAISGTPGLFRYVAQSKGGIIVESLDVTGRRQVVSGSAKVSALGDIAIFTLSEEVALGDVLEKIRVKYSGAAVEVSAKSTPEELAAFLEGALPEFDRERVHNSDIKKIAQWYNLLIASGVDSFIEKEEEVASEAVTDIVATTKKATAPKKPTAVKAKTGSASSKPKVTATKSTTARKSS